MPAVGELKTRKAASIFGIGNQARSPFISTVDRLNAVIEMSENGRQQTALVGLPGLVEVADWGINPARAIFAVDGRREFFIVAGADVFRVTPGDAVKILTLDTASGPVWMDASNTQLLINDGVTPYIYTFATQALTSIIDPDYPAGARGATYLEGRFWVYVTSGQNAGRVYASDILDGLAWDGLNFFSPSSKPSEIVAVERQLDDLLVISKGSIEWWGSAPTPVVGALGFQPSASAATELGGLSEAGFAKVGQRFFLLGQSSGDAGIYEVKGYSVVSVPCPRFDVELSALASDAAICTGYSIANHDLFQITIQGDDTSSAMTWIHDVSTGHWSRRSSYHKPYYRGLLARGAVADVYITDAFTGKLYQMTEGVLTENGDPLEYEITSTHLLQEGDHITLHEIQIDMKTGIGNAIPPGENPHGVLSISKDGGRTWCIERHVPLGKAGEYVRRARTTQLGSARDFAVRFRITDPVPRIVTGAYLVMDPNYA